jgi:hydantoinase/carbamoylase family amidase
MGGRTLLGLAGPEAFDHEIDEAGVTWREALAEARAAGHASPAGGPSPLFRPGLLIEPHIEQGPVLESEGLTLGIVERIAGFGRWRVRVTGEARHSGTMPMKGRRDALAAAAEMILGTESLAAELGPPAVATAGYVHVEPGLFNVVPGAVELWLEVRHVELDRLEQGMAELAVHCRAIAARRGVEAILERVPGEDPTALSAALADLAVELATELGIPHRRMSSGAAHDAMIFARAGVPALMLFVPSRGGISHSPEEHTGAEDLLAGYRFADELVRRLAAREVPIHS